MDRFLEPHPRNIPPRRGEPSGPLPPGWLTADADEVERRRRRAAEKAMRVFDLPWNPAKLEQRLGQERKTRFRGWVSAGAATGAEEGGSGQQPSVLR